MTSTRQNRDRFFGISLRAEKTALSLAVTLALTVFATGAAQAQTYNVLYTFSGRADGADPEAGLTMDRAGNLYGTTSLGGYYDFGTVFKLSNRGSGWVFNNLYSFQGLSDGGYPQARVTIGPDGSFYGTTSGSYDGGGTVFNLRPPATACKTSLCDWTYTVLYSFTGGPSDGDEPTAEVVFDQVGNLYGTTVGGGLESCPGMYGGCGVVFKLAPSNGGWTESVPYKFTKQGGYNPTAGVIFDKEGNLYGTAQAGGASNFGVVFQLTPSGSGWTEKILHSFGCSVGDGLFPLAGLILDGSGNLYGATYGGGSGGGGTVFELSPSDGNWTFSVLYSFTGIGGPLGSLAMDAAGTLYGTTEDDGAYGWGSVFKLTPSNGGWAYTSLHDFTGGKDGGNPVSNVIFDANGNLYGTASAGGSQKWGVVWEITP